MEKRQLKLGDKVKMKLIQPRIKCHGRSDVVAYYRGIIVAGHYSGVEETEYFIIQFKYKGEIVQARYNFTKDAFVKQEYQDIKIVG